MLGISLNSEERKIQERFSSINIWRLRRFPDRLLKQRVNEKQSLTDSTYLQFLGALKASLLAITEDRRTFVGNSIARATVSVYMLHYSECLLAAPPV